MCAGAGTAAGMEWRRQWGHTCTKITVSARVQPPGPPEIGATAAQLWRPCPRGTGRKISGQMVAKTEPGDSAEESVGLHIPRKSPTHTRGGGEGGEGRGIPDLPKKDFKITPG